MNDTSDRNTNGWVRRLLSDSDRIANLLNRHATKKEVLESLSGVVYPLFGEPTEDVSQRTHFTQVMTDNVTHEITNITVEGTNDVYSIYGDVKFFYNSTEQQYVDNNRFFSLRCIVQVSDTSNDEKLHPDKVVKYLKKIITWDVNLNPDTENDYGKVNVHE